MIAFVLLLSVAQPEAEQTRWDCRVMKVAGAEGAVGELSLHFVEVADEVTVEVRSKMFPEFSAGIQPLVSGPASEVADRPSWLIKTSSGELAFDPTVHWSRNGEGSAILISHYEMSAIAGLPEDFFEYRAAGLCTVSKGADQ